MHAEATPATTALLRRGETVHIIPQNLYEFWSVATREIQYNGLGLSIIDAQAELARLKTLFLFLPDSPAIYPEWERLVTRHAVRGRDAHDTRIVAAMNVHSITHLLTFNKDDFKRFPGITVLLPSEV
jgi:predicted nucleic acid-binding protein